MTALSNPKTNRHDDGTSIEFEGAVSGAFNKARTKASGRWSLKVTERDAAGTVTDTCDSGSALLMHRSRAWDRSGLISDAR